MVGPQEMSGFTASADPGDPAHVQKFRREKTYFLFGLIPVWHVSEEHNVFDARSPGERGGEQEEE